MRHWTSAAILLLAASGTSITTAFAQRGMSRGPMNYDTATETIVTGTVQEVNTIQPGGRGMGGLHLIVSAADGTLEVHLGPAAFVASKSFSFAAGDAVTVTGSKVTMAGQPVVLAREIQKGTERLTLRDEKGFPLWAGRGVRPPAR